MKSFLPKILLTGANGQMGMALRYHPRAAEFHLIACSHKDLDITHSVSIENAILKFYPDVIINTAAYTAVDKAEQERERVLFVNHIGAKQLAITCKQHQIPLFHLSTDYVFDGTSSSPYREEDKTNPINVYGESKWLGEQAIRENCEQHTILRVSGIFSEYGHNFLKTMLRLANEKKELKVVSDQITCPTYAGDIANALFSIVVQQHSRWGTYHFCNADPVSWQQFAASIIHVANQYQPLLIKEVKAISTADYPTLATRPAYSVLNCDKVNTHFGIKQTSWRDALTTIIPLLIRKGIDS